MKVTIDLSKVKDFVFRHKEAVAVACIAAIVIRRQANYIQSMDECVCDTGYGTP